MILELLLELDALKEREGECSIVRFDISVNSDMHNFRYSHVI